MHLTVRPATPDDGTTVGGMLDAAYGGGYSATFDHDGPLAPHDIWFAHVEKDIGLIEVDRCPAGLLVVARGRGQWLVEEAVVPGYGGLAPRSRETLVARLGEMVVQRFRQGRQSALLLRAVETNAFGLALAHGLHATFANALLVFRLRGSKRPPSAAPSGYQIRRATPDDARVAGRLVREIVEERSRADEVAHVLVAREDRGWLALRDALPVGFAALEIRPGRADWIVGVREPHRGRGIGRALASAAIGALLARNLAPFATAWALDPVAGSFLGALGFSVERTYLYVERPL